MLQSLKGALILGAMALLQTACTQRADPATARPQPEAPNPVPAVTLQASATTVAPGATTTLSWSSTNADECSASGGWQGSRTTQGSETSAALEGLVKFELSCHGPGGTTTAVVQIDARGGGTSPFPLRVEGRHLVDATGAPFLIQGDAAWSLIAQLDQAGVEKYLQDRRARGFNTLLVSLIEHRYSNHPPANAYGAEPFRARGDFSQPNDAYFTHADWVLKRANELGFAVLLVPAYLGWEGGDDGWYHDLMAASDDTLKAYGAYLGNRYRNLRNIIWTYGGDYDPPEKRVVNLIAAGVSSVDPDALGTAHNGPFTSPAEFWSGESWLDLNNVYTTEPVYAAALKEYDRRSAKPFFFMEGAYENERDATVTRIRTQAYHALLSGAMGQVFGNSPIWHFNAPNPPYPTTTPWAEALGQPGSVSMTWLWGLFSSRNWWLLQPDESNLLLIGGFGDGQRRAVAALAEDKSFAIAYVPETRTIQLDLSRLRGPCIKAEWMNAATGMRVSAMGSPFKGDAAQSLTTPSSSDKDASDWALLLDSLASGC